MTEPRYLTDSTARRFEATVERTLDDRVVLDATLFYPEGGGQPADHGTLTVDGGTGVGGGGGDANAGTTSEGGDGDGGTEGGGGDSGDGGVRAGRWRVVDVQKRDTVYHELEPLDGTNGLPAAGTTVVGELDWERRWAHMRYHTAQHLLSAVLLDAFDARTVGNQLSADYARLDAEHDRFDEDDLAHVERRLNALVDDARPVEWYTMDRAEAEATLDTDRTRIDLLPASITDLRIVEIGAPTRGAVAESDGTPFDRTACAGTHVSNTSEIGTIRVTGRTTQGREKERVTFELE